MNSHQQANDSPVCRDDHQFREYRAPRGNGATFLEPSIAGAPQLLRDNQQVLAGHDAFWQSLRQRGRRQLIADAKRYTSAYRDIDWITGTDNAPIIMAGHQPAIFHPGVWFKNFALSHLSEASGALAINLVVDNDVASGSSIRVPTIDPATGAAVYRFVAYDQAGGGVPYEQSTITDREQFQRFDREVIKAVAPLVSDPCVDRLWHHARGAIDRCGVAGCALAQARHALEAEIGLRTLEIPLAVVCRGDTFAEFVLSILIGLRRFHQCYNESTDLYRKAHGIRSRAHPVPNLAEQDGWLEAPLWIYGNSSPERRAAWVKLASDHLVLGDRNEREIRIETAGMAAAAQQLCDGLGPELKLRPRALLTTMYARTVLSDLFLHGIGGAKYDQLGDLITSSFFDITPPAYMVVSATIQLPGVQSSDHGEQIRSLKRALRDTLYQPERFADQLTSQRDIIDRKRGLLATIPPKGRRGDWHRQIAEINQQLSAGLESVRADLRQQLARAQRQVGSQKILQSREHPFCIFPLEYLRETFNSMVQRP